MDGYGNLDAFLRVLKDVPELRIKEQYTAYDLQGRSEGDAIILERVASEQRMLILVSPTRQVRNLTGNS